MTEETPQQAARYTSFGHDFQKLVAASSGVSNPVFEMNWKKKFEYNLISKTQDHLSKS